MVLLISQTAQVKWNSRNKKHYISKGYEFTKMGDSFDVKIEDLTCGSYAEVTLVCDYCGKYYSSKYQTYRKIKDNELIHTDACKDCCQKKALETTNLKYGSAREKFFKTNQKRKDTNMKIYGCSNPFANKDIQNKIRESNMQKYGVPYAAQNPKVFEMKMKSCKEKYGVNHYVELFKGKFIGKNSPRWKDDKNYKRAERATHQYITWRKSVFDRDRYTCQKCGARNGNGYKVIINAHHILNWKDNPESRYDIDNGITLCKKCHTLFHSIFGKKNNNQKQLDSFLKYNNLDKKIC